MIFFKSANVLSSYFLRCDIISFFRSMKFKFPTIPKKRGKETKENKRGPRCYARGQK